VPAQVQAPDMPPGLQHKSATVEPIVTTDDDTGEVTAVVSVTNVVDEVGDIILPGAYTATLAKRKPKGVWSHSWKDWVARTEEIREYPPGDPQLKSLLDEAGASLPADAGALVVRCKFNMKDPDSYNAYQKVKFFSETNECQWSIGYSVPPGKGVRDSKGVRKIHGLDLFEYSPVLFGAASQSTSLSVKSVDPAQWPDGEPETVTAVPEDTSGAVPLQPVDDQVAGDGVIPEDQILSDDDPLPDLDEPVSDEALDSVENVAREAAGDSTPEDGPTMPEEKSPESVINIYQPATEMEAEIVAAVRKRLGLDEVKYDTSPVGTPGGRQNWVDKAGGLPPFIRAVAHALMREGHSKAKAIQLAVGTIRRWAAGGGDVTAKTRAKAAATIAEWDAKRSGKDAKPADTESADTGPAEVPAAEPAAAEATSGEPAGLLTKWDPTAEVGRHAAYRSTPESDGLIRLDFEEKDFPQLAGTHEERREMLRAALSDLLAADGVKDAETMQPWVHIDGTWDDEVVATVHDGTPQSDPQTWRVPYTVESGNGRSTVALGTPRPTRLVVAADAATDAEPDLPPVLLDGVDAAMLGAKLLSASPQVKAGRVLSGSNAERIASAVESLIAVLTSAGVHIEMPQAAAVETPEETPVEAKAVDAEEINADELMSLAAELRVLSLRS
jgi:hypothetical protein